MNRMTVKNLADYIGASEHKIYELVRQKKIPHFKIGAKTVFRKEAIDQWIEQQEAQNCAVE